MCMSLAYTITTTSTHTTSVFVIVFVILAGNHAEIIVNFFGSRIDASGSRATGAFQTTIASLTRPIKLVSLQGKETRSVKKSSNAHVPRC